MELAKRMFTSANKVVAEHRKETFAKRQKKQNRTARQQLQPAEKSFVYTNLDKIKE